MRLIASFSFLIFAVAAQATELTPHFFVRRSEGVLVRRPYFADGDKKYGIRIDSETRLTAYQGGALFRFDHLPSAALQLRASAVPATTGFRPETLAIYEKSARTLLPSGATEVTLVATEVIPIRSIDGRASDSPFPSDWGT